MTMWARMLIGMVVVMVVMRGPTMRLKVLERVCVSGRWVSWVYKSNTQIQGNAREGGCFKKYSGPKAPSVAA